MFKSRRQNAAKHARHLVAAGLVLATAFLTVGCGPSQNPIGAQDTQLQFENTDFHTGSEKTIRNFKGKGDISVPYTISGQKKIIDKMRTKPVNATDMFVANTIQSVLVLTYDNNGALTDQRPSQLQLNVKFKSLKNKSSEVVSFRSELQLGNNQLFVKNLEQRDGTESQYPYFADITCHDFNCQTIEIWLKRFTRDKDKKIATAAGEVRIFYRSSYPAVRLVREKKNANTKLADPVLNAIAESVKSKKAVRTSVVVVNGPSHSKIEIPGFLEIETDLLDTQSETFEVNRVKVLAKGNIITDPAHINTELIGNDPASGSLAFDFYSRKSKEMIRLYVEDKSSDEEVAQAIEHVVEPLKEKEVKKETKKIPPIPSLPPATVGIRRQIFHTADITPAQYPESSQVIALLDEHIQDSETQRMIRVWLGLEKQRGCRAGNFNYATLQKYFTYKQPVAPYVEKLTKTLDVTPEIAYLTLLESSYAKREDYPTEEVGPGAKTTALGPWQINDGTAFDIRRLSQVPFVIHRVRSRIPDDRDDRTYFLNSTYMAATHLKRQFQEFSDPAMAIFAYHAGVGGASKAIRNTEKLKQFDVTLKDVLRYQMQTKTNCVYINYTYAFLAARAIGQYPDFVSQYADNTKITFPAPTTSRDYLKRLINPFGKLPAGIL